MDFFGGDQPQQQQETQDAGGFGFAGGGGFGGTASPPPVQNFGEACGQSEHIAKFEAESQAALSQRMQETDSKHSEVRQRAHEEIAKMAADRKRRIEDRKARNRQAEADQEQDRKRLEEGGDAKKWERVVNMVDLKGDEKKLRKTARMRQIFLYLKNDQK